MRSLSSRSVGCLIAILLFAGNISFASATDTFSISTVNGTSYSNGLSIPNGTLTFAGTGMPGAHVAIGTLGTKGVVEWNVIVDSSGNWSLSTITSSFPSWVVYFGFESYKEYTPSATSSFTFSLVFPSTSTSSSLSNFKCMVNGDTSDTNLYAIYGSTFTCSASTTDTATQAKMTAWYTSWGDIYTNKQQTGGNTTLPVSCASWVCTVTFPADYHGYSLSRDIWFENSSGKTASISIVMSDPNSSDYAAAKEYLQTKYSSSSSQGSTSSSSSSTSSTSTTSSTTSSSTSLRITAYLLSWETHDFGGGTIVVPSGTSLELVGRWKPNSNLYLTRGNSADFVSSSISVAGTWSIFGLGTVYKGKAIVSGHAVYTLSDDAWHTLDVLIDFQSTSLASSSGTVSSTGSTSSSIFKGISAGDYVSKNAKSSSWIVDSGILNKNTLTDSGTTSGLSTSEKEKVEQFFATISKNSRNLSSSAALRYIKRAEIKIRLLGLKGKAKNDINYRAMKYLLPKFAELREWITNR